MRLAFLGTPDFAVLTLAALIEAGHEIACVYTRAARPAGRGQKERLSPVEIFARAAGLDVRTPRDFKSAEERAMFAALALDAAVVVAYGLILPREVLQAPRLGCFNVHASLLPRWRGAAPIQRAIMAGDAQTGVSIMRMEEGLDTGPVLMSERVAIGPRATAGALHDELAARGAALMIRTLSTLEQGALKPVPQASAGVTYAKKIDKAETRIDWRRSADELDRLIRALAPLPGAWLEAPDRSGAPSRIRILAAHPASGSGVPGEIVSLAPLVVACGGGALELVTLQRAGGGALGATEFLRGFPLAAGMHLS